MRRREFACQSSKGVHSCAENKQHNPFRLNLHLCLLFYVRSNQFIENYATGLTHVLTSEFEQIRDAISERFGPLSDSKVSVFQDLISWILQMHVKIRLTTRSFEECFDAIFAEFGACLHCAAAVGRERKKDRETERD